MFTRDETAFPMTNNDTSKALLRQLLLALVLLTRLPFPKLSEADFEDSAKAVWAYPIVGLMTGVIAALAIWIGLGMGLSPMIAAGLGLAAGMVATGAMHEDGLVDCFDGFWGGDTAQKRLNIMKDSQIGTYGVLALLIITGLRWGALGALLVVSVTPVIAAAMLSRASMPVLMAMMPHARDTGLSRSVGKPAIHPVIIGVAIATVLSLILIGWGALACVIIAGLVAGGWSLIAHQKIGGQTGDVLGAVQQLTETAVLLTLLALWS